MSSKEHDEIKQSVRQFYGNIAKTNSDSSNTSQASSCCGPVQIMEKQEKKATACCAKPGASDDNLYELKGYKTEELDSFSDIDSLKMGLGCGNPTAIASLKSGEIVVDLGSGGGFDCFLAAKQVGEKGKVIGVDMTPDMLSKARANAKKLGAANVEFRLGEIEHLPIADNTADIIISNCVINLAPDKLSVYKEAFRVLKPGGRLAIADTMAKDVLPEEVKNDLKLWSCCIGGAITADETEKKLKEAGFLEITITANKDYQDTIDKWSSKSAQIFPAYIEAKKPL
jgi:ubiquinone/menaquinone biosynthesis C-methylase UbiE